MSELESEEEKVLAGARRVFEPSDADAARVLRATSLALGLPGGAALGAASGAESVPSSVATSGPKIAAIGGVGKWLAGVAVVVAAAGGGYALGFRAGHDLSRRDAAVLAAPVTVTRPEPTVTAPIPPPPAAEPVRLEPLPSADAAPASKLATTPLARTPSLQAELRSLRRVESALREGKPDIALRFLSQLDRDIPHGQLLEERAAAWALARCGQAPAVGIAHDFAQRHPGSVYSERVLTACGAPAADSFGNRKPAP